MWQKLKDQLPAILLTAALIIGVAFWLHTEDQKQMADQQQAIAALREQNEAAKQSLDETRTQLDNTSKLLKEAVAKREADLFRTDQEIAQLNTQRMDALAEAIAKKVQPYNPLPKSPEEAERMQNEQVDKVSSRMAEKIQPILLSMSKDQNLTREQIARYSEKISEQVGGALTAEMARNQELNNDLRQSEAVAADSMRLSHEVTALYLSTFKDQGIVTRLLTLPAAVVKDAASLSIINSNDRKKVEDDLVARMNEIDKRQAEIEAKTPKS